ncbi:glycoside hydrolase family 16 protein [Cellulomonas fimi]|uniref:Glycoside hydrolase family 16 n=1 Tax=Cellulomonas fimi (strain ATCC 484 / DSM 20113 / JCM 1341 / CCUG 24087 / LMG 16345 / NBRC 15513 / NCIMB 8980 / NCTC 7547 / NRS-133) TaxID=590998 RepID=F4GZR2_CELFA|nr:glycoside hydrolase family 16 protein [Cellulomonas fimi]AEE47228.1 glycoside hydrolase family 16 [Cellulomonas fimi ATCC 484]NNH08451.1 family 16 glycosylhydrolase [Cellulomonas fimi]VEH35653.1 Glucan endo-1,3-beta-glucosidase precursor [Cellulomonas fimi]
MHARLRTATPIPARRRRAAAAALGAATLVAAGLVASSPAAPAEAAVGDIVWAQEFDGASGSAPDSSVWSYDTGAGGWGNAELQSYTTSRSNSALDGQGNLVITARREADGSYTSARLQSNDKVELKYGRVEARIQIPRGQGIWPAFWMLGADFPQTSWPSSGEIDVMENVGKEPHRIYGTVHGPGYSGGSGISGMYQHPQGWSFADTFHTYAVDWKPGSITWSVDGNVYHQVTTSRVGSNPWVFDKPYFLILNVAVGGQWPGYPDATTQLPQQMKVDYVRVYDNGSGGGGGGGGLPTGTGTVKLANSLCLDVPWAQTHDGNPIQVVNCNGNAAQQWTRGSDGTIRALGKCLDVSNSGKTNGTVVQLWTCNGTGAQRWTYDSGTRALKNPQSGRCLDGVGGLPVHDGQRVQIWDCNTQANQQWYL